MKMKPIAVIAAIVTAISVFLPWIGVSSSYSYGGYSGGHSTGGLSGMNFGGAWLVLIASIGGIVLLFKQEKFAAIPGVLCVLIALSYIVGWMGGGGGAGFSSSFGGGHASASVDKYYGLYVCLIGSIAYTATSGLAAFKKD